MTLFGLLCAVGLVSGAVLGWLHRLVGSSEPVQPWWVGVLAAHGRPRRRGRGAGA